jgi:transposase
VGIVDCAQGVQSHPLRTEPSDEQSRRQAVEHRTTTRKYVGLDVHKATVAIAVADAQGGEARCVGTVANELSALKTVLSKLGEPGELHVTYEAGPTGYGLYRWLVAQGYQAQVIAPSLIPRKAGDRVKTDRRDARNLARLARAGELTAITVPDAGDEAVRDLTRAREDAVGARRVARQQLQGLLLRHGIVYSGRTRWTKAHTRWLGTLKMPDPMQQIVLTEYWLSVQRADEQVARLTQALRDALPTWRWSAVVSALMSLRGIDVVAASTLVAEIGDVRRFDQPRELMAFLGLVPSEHSSGAAIRKGSITKTGNGHARRMLVEAAWNYRFPARVGRQLQRRQETQPEAVRALSWKSQQRLCKRFRSLSQRGLHQNKVCVAVARELAGFVWAMARVAQPAA